MYMTKTAQQTVVRSISRKREQIATLREELEDLNDYLDLVEARVRDAANRVSPTPKSKNATA